MNKRVLIFAAFLVFTFTSLALFLLSSNKNQELTIQVEPTNLIVNIVSADYTASESTSSKTYTASNGQKIKLPKGDYVVSAKDTSETKAFDQIVTVGDKPVTFTVSADYSTSRLNTILKSEISPATKVMRDKYGPELQLFDLTNFQLYKKGEWMSVDLKPNNPALIDTYHLVLRKQGANWNLVTTPPDLIISSQKYPEIPKDILYSINTKK